MKWCDQCHPPPPLFPPLLSPWPTGDDVMIWSMPPPPPPFPLPVILCPHGQPGIRWWRDQCRPPPPHHLHLPSPPPSPAPLCVCMVNPRPVVMLFPPPTHTHTPLAPPVLWMVIGRVLFQLASVFNRYCFMSTETVQTTGSPGRPPPPSRHS